MILSTDARTDQSSAFVFSVIKLYHMTFLLDGPGPLDLVCKFFGWHLYYYY